MNSDQMPTYNCPICTSSDIEDLLQIPDVPIFCNLLWRTKEGAMSTSRGDINLGFCSSCGHIYNKSFNPKLMQYSQSYENSLHFSPSFQAYAESLAARLVEKYALYNKDIIEIGSGQGDFLKMLCNLGDNRGTGFDPSYVPLKKNDIEPPTEPRVSFIPDYYSEKFAHYQADFFVSRHVFEHIFKPDDFLAMISRVIQGKPVVFFEVPNALFTLRELGIWDIIYEHYSYFTPFSLGRAFWENGFHILDISETFNGQFLTIEATLLSDMAEVYQFPNEGFDNLKRYVAIFADNYREKVLAWEDNLRQFSRHGLKVVIWGAGSKGVTFLNIHRDYHNIDYVVDINPRKKGMYVAGSGQEIVPAEFLGSYQPDIVIIMNPNYLEEIKQSLKKHNAKADIIVA